MAITVDPVAKYARRPRHKTKEDKYLLKTDQDSKQRGRTKEMKYNGRSTSRRKKTGASLKQDFRAANIDAQRITLQPSTALGFLVRSKSSAFFEHKDTPDLTFPNMNFLSRRGHAGRDEVDDRAPRLHRRPHQKANQDVSQYFAQPVGYQATMRSPRAKRQHSLISRIWSGQSSDLSRNDDLASVTSNFQQSETFKIAFKGQHNSKSKVAEPCKIRSRQHKARTSEATEFHKTRHLPGEDSRVSWSTTPPRDDGCIASNAHRKAIDQCAVSVKPFEEKSSTQPTSQHLRQNSSFSHPFDQYTRKALIGEEPGFWINPSNKHDNRRTDLSLEDLKNLSAKRLHSRSDTLSQIRENAFYHEQARSDRNIDVVTTAQSEHVPKKAYPSVQLKHPRNRGLHLKRDPENVDVRSRPDLLPLSMNAVQNHEEYMQQDIDQVSHSRDRHSPGNQLCSYQVSNLASAPSYVTPLLLSKQQDVDQCHIGNHMVKRTLQKSDDAPSNMTSILDPRIPPYAVQQTTSCYGQIFDDYSPYVSTRLYNSPSVDVLACGDPLTSPSIPYYPLSMELTALEGRSDFEPDTAASSDAELPLSANVSNGRVGDIHQFKDYEFDTLSTMHPPPDITRNSLDCGGIDLHTGIIDYDQEPLQNHLDLGPLIHGKELRKVERRPLSPNMQPFTAFSTPFLLC